MDKRIELTETEKQVLGVLESRWLIGRKKYKEGISYKQSKSIKKWLNNAIEEAADLLQYLVALKLEIDRREKLNERK